MGKKQPTMLSVLIPTYNVNLHPLISELQPQLNDCQIEYEIIIADDMSSDSATCHHNSMLGEMENVTYIEHTENLGRSKTRNHLADIAKFPYLLFLDCDARVKHKFYIADYLKFIQSKHLKGVNFAVSGGLSYHSDRPSKDKMLRYKYGIHREVRSAALRNTHPYHNFTPFNLLIAKSVFETCRFDETLEGYGYEDTFFGIELEKVDFPVYHIDNEMYHDGLDDNRTFLRKIKDSVRNLDKLYRDGKVNERFLEQSRLLQAWKKYSESSASSLIFGALKLMRPIITNLMMQANSLKAMDMYKLLLFDELRKSAINC